MSISLIPERINNILFLFFEFLILVLLIFLNLLVGPKIEVGTEINASRLKLNSKNIFIVKNVYEFLKIIKFITKNNILFKRNKNNFFEQVNKKNIAIFY